MKQLLIFCLLISIVTACKQKSPTPVAPVVASAPPNLNFLKFSTGTYNYHTVNVSGQWLISNNDTLFIMNFYKNNDTISGGLNLINGRLGTAIYDSIASANNNFGITYGNTNSPNTLYSSKASTVTLTDFREGADWVFSGTFSAIMYLQSNPSQTFAVTNGSFYYHPSL